MYTVYYTKRKQAQMKLNEWHSNSSCRQQFLWITAPQLAKAVSLLNVCRLASRIPKVKFPTLKMHEFDII